MNPLYKTLPPGQIFIVFENGEILTKEEADPAIYKPILSNVGFKHRTTVRVSKKGNRFLTKAGICEYCGEERESRNLLKSICPECARELRDIKNGVIHKRAKKKPIKGQLTALQIAYAITGDYPRIYRNFDIEDSWEDVFFDIERSSTNPLINNNNTGIQNRCIIKDVTNHKSKM